MYHHQWMWYGFELLRNLFLRFAGNAALDLFSGTGINAFRVSGFPVGVLLALSHNCFLSDCAVAGCGFSCHFFLPFRGSCAIVDEQTAPVVFFAF